MMRLLNIFVPAALAIAAGASFAKDGKEPLIEVLPQVEAACTNVLVSRTVEMVHLGVTIGEASGTSSESLAEMEKSIKEKGQELISAVGVVTGSSLYKNPALPSATKEGIQALRDMCQEMEKEVPLFVAALEKEHTEGLYKAHLAEDADLGAEMLMLEQYVLVKHASELIAHSHFEPLLMSLLQVDELEAEIQKLQKKL